MTVETYLANWLVLRSLEVKPRTVESYRYCLEHLKPLIGAQPVEALNPADVKQALAAIVKLGHSRTAEMCYVMLKAALADLDPSPMKGVKRPKHKQKRPKPWNDAQIQLYLSACLVHPHGLPLSLGLLLGLRRGEICGLRWSDIDFGAATVHICNQRQRMATGEIVDCPPKSESSDRVLPVPDALMRQLRSRRQIGGYLCSITPSGLDAAHRRLVSQLALPPIPLHGLRHSMATACLRHNGDMKALQILLGHASYATTADVYSHPDMSILRKTLDAGAACVI